MFLHKILAVQAAFLFITKKKVVRIICIIFGRNRFCANDLVIIVTLFRKINTVEPRLSEPYGRHTIRPDNRGVRMDEGSLNSRSMGYRVGDN